MVVYFRKAFYTLMIKKILILLFISFFINTSTVLAGSGYKIGGAECDRTDPNGLCVDGYSCQPSLAIPSKYLCQPAKIGGKDCSLTDVNGNPTPNGFCVGGYSCKPSQSIPKNYLCQPSTTSDVFGKIQPPDALKGFLQKDPTGTGALSQFLSNLVALIFSIAAIVLIFMILWGAFDWMISEGDKEKLAAAQRKIINAIVGIVLFAIAFAIIGVLGRFTGFTFFKGQTNQANPVPCTIERKHTGDC